MRLTGAVLSVSLLMLAACSGGGTAAMYGDFEPRCFPGKCETETQGAGRMRVDVNIYGGGKCAISSEVARNANWAGPRRFAVTMVGPDTAVWADVVAEHGTFEAVQEFDKGFGWVEVEVEAVGLWNIRANCDG
ncbi:hypothetical protein [Candidatus Poriferisocius sp.]|uniref:hypothetical protein n=1 Tax=Candidatus Poriferisocius sp. TaxID=3101276 RepID=UPI003B013B9C